jgi:ABC-2 type transport system ATP-binding protein
MAEQGERTILLSSHDMNVVQDICERVIIINHGRIVADDRIENLQKLFTASAYRFEIEGHLSPQQQQKLTKQFDMVKISTDGSRTIIEAELLDSQKVYEIIDVLRENGCQLESVGKQYPDLEEIFLRIVKGEKQ